MQWFSGLSKKGKTGVGCLTLIVLAVLLSIFSPSSPDTDTPSDSAPVADAPADTSGDAAATDEPEPTDESEPTEAPEAAPGVGTGVSVGDSHGWIVHSVEDRGQTIESGNQFIPNLQTSGKFILVTAGMLNDGTDAVHITSPKVVDSQGREFDANTDAMMIVSDQLRCIFEEVNPGLQKDCAWVYEVPADATGLKLRVTGGLFDTPVDIDLGM